MQSIAAALIAALRTLFVPRMLVLMVWPMLGALLFWLGLAFLFWGSWHAVVAQWLASTPAEQWIASGFLAVASGYLISLVLVMLLVPAIYVTALVITAVFAMPAMVDEVASRHYPELERKHGGTTAGSVVNSVIAIAVYCLTWLLTLPLWLISPLAIALPIILSAYLNQRLFRYDALAEHASREEFDSVIERATGKLYVMGAIVGLLQFVPVLNLFSPVYIGLAFVHLCLAELDQLRRQPA